jgi:energy-coupling factor transport system ATP-binding protein
LIRVEHLSFYYSDSESPALKNVNMKIEDGEFVLITGPSGGGKSSLCRCFNGLIPHFYGGRFSGTVTVQDTDILKSSTRELATRVGMIFQDPENQLVSVDVEREVAFGMENLAFPRNIIAKRLEESLDTLGIAGLRHRQLHELSGGEKQKVAIASVLALHPDILILDEPTSELDPKSAEEVLNIISRLNDELGITVILIEHRIDRVIQHVDRVVLVSRGSIITDGGPRDVFNSRFPEETGIDLPPITRLVRGLQRKGIPLKGTPLTVKEGRILLQDIFSNASGEIIDPPDNNNGTTIAGMEKVWYAYNNGPAALKDISLKIDEGEFIAVMGRNASGKTTLAKHLNGLLLPSKGHVSIEGSDTRKATVAQLARTVGYVFQNPNDHLFADTVEDEIRAKLKNLQIDGNTIKSAVEDALDTFKIAQYRTHYPRYLSGGEKQRVALASVIVAQPKLLILDEPTRGMDYSLKSELMAFLDDYRQKGNTVVLVTHDVEIVAEHVDRVILLSEGNIIVDDDKRNVLSRALLFSPQINRLVQAFESLPENILTADEMIRLLP